MGTAFVIIVRLNVLFAGFDLTWMVSNTNTPLVMNWVKLPVISNVWFVEFELFNVEFELTIWSGASEFDELVEFVMLLSEADKKPWLS